MKRLELRDFKLDALRRSRRPSGTALEKDLMARYVDALKVSLGIDRLVLYAADLDGDKWQLLVAAGTDGHGLGLNQRPSSRGSTSTRLGWLCAGRRPTPFGCGGAHPPKRRSHCARLGRRYHRRRPRREPGGQALEPARDLTNVLVVARRNAQMVARSLKQEALRREVQLAGEMQAMLLPRSWDHLDLDVAGCTSPTPKWVATTTTRSPRTQERWWCAWRTSVERA